MSELLLELLSEEIPASMQVRAQTQLHDILAKLCQERHLHVDAIDVYSTPRRLTAIIKGLPETQSDEMTELKGPKVDAPEVAIEGFLRKTGLTKDQLEMRETDKGRVYFAVTHVKGGKIADVFAKTLPDILKDFHWPKSMKWSANTMQWVRPLHGIVCLFDGVLVPFEFGHLSSSDTTKGHRFMSPDAFKVTSVAQYLDEMERRHVVLDREKRKEIILNGIHDVASPLGCTLKEDQGLLEEVVGLVEYPVVVLGKFDRMFMSVPPEALITAMRVHQKYFSLKDAHGTMAPYFVAVSNIKTADDQEKIRNGFERVLTARLEDARFFFQQDQKKKLEDYVPTLKHVVFHAKLGDLLNKTKRLEVLAKFIGVWVPKTDLLFAERAAQLCKADLVTDMVGEFPELQGLMGYYYALANDEPREVAQSIMEHYAPKGPSDMVPSAPISIVVSLADKIDTLVGLFAIGEVPTGSKDPFALRRAALGIIRTILQNELRIPLKLLLEKSISLYPKSVFIKEPLQQEEPKRKKPKLLKALKKKRVKHGSVIQQLLEFMEERLRVLLKEEGLEHDLIAAVFDGGCEDDFTRLRLRVQALKSFLATDAGAQLLFAYKRAANIVVAEEKKDETSFDGSVKEDLLSLPPEKVLYERFSYVQGQLVTMLKKGRFIEAMEALSALHEPINEFFEEVVVNVEDKALRKNRLQLLSGFIDCMHEIANFSLVQ